MQYEFTQYHKNVLVGILRSSSDLDTTLAEVRKYARNNSYWAGIVSDKSSCDAD